MAALPGYSGAAIKLNSHTEPHFVSGLPERQIYEVFAQYRATPYRTSSSSVHPMARVPTAWR